MDEAPLSPPVSAPRIESLRVRNFRALRDLELRDLTPLTAFVGPNGSGKSTVFDVFAFLHEAFTTSLRAAVESRYGMRELRSRGEEGPIEIEIRYRTEGVTGELSYGFGFNEVDDEIVVTHESLQPGSDGPDQSRTPTLKRDQGPLILKEDSKDPSRLWLAEEDQLALAVMGQIGQMPVAVALRRFISDWYVSDIDATDVRSIPGAGSQRRLSATGDNVANVLEWLAERRPERLEAVLARLREWVPRLESVRPVETGDGRFMLQLKDATFERGIPARFASEGTLKLLAYLTVLLGTDTPALMAFEEPESNLPPQLLYALGDEFRIAAGRSQIFVNTHSSVLLDALRPEEVRALYRDEAGFTRTVRTADMPGVREMMDAGAALGALWQEGFFSVGNPLRNGGAPGISGAA